MLSGIIYARYEHLIYDAENFMRNIYAWKIIPPQKSSVLNWG